MRIALLGPVTLALGLRAAGVPTDRAVELAEVVVARRAAAMLGAVRDAMPTGVVLVCASEPGLVGAMHPTFPLAPAAGARAADRRTSTRSTSTPTPVSCSSACTCPGAPTGSTIIASGVSVVSAPADRGLVGWAERAGGLLRPRRSHRLGCRAGRPAARAPARSCSGAGCSAMWCELVGEGMDPLLLRSRSLVGPVDGLGHFGVTQAERVLDLVDSLAVRVRRQAIGARLTLGA